MLTTYRLSGQSFEATDRETAAGEDIVWIDLMDPTREEEQLAEQAFGVDVPTREETQEIESSSRLYAEHGAKFMTATVIYQADAPRPQATSVTFILAGGRLITLRYEDLTPFRTFIDLHDARDQAAGSGRAIMLGLLEAIVDRSADILEQVGADMSGISHEIFLHGDGAGDTTKDRPQSLQTLLQSVGRSGDILSKASESLVNLARLLTFLERASTSEGVPDENARLAVLNRDVNSLSSHTDTLSEKADFLLSATLGMINIEQTKIIKIFSVAAVIFLPPTLVASIYGMNFKYMPALDWLFGYPLAILIMIGSAVVPYWFFKRRGWL